ncbi:unnamed protein product [Rhizoctonia solani]|uniref:Protein kinase domain-containing protein n=1 Tax=Rhizoctonia solani TaxID=456999 RepID=A0A8H2X573_9AGAM|nr:unnamed protein product [Rhizoctonia solani]
MIYKKKRQHNCGMWKLTIPGSWPQPDLVSGKMVRTNSVKLPISTLTFTFFNDKSSDQVAKLLIKHGCKDITAELDLEHCNHIPFTRGGFGLIHQGMLKNGQLVAIKCIEMTGCWASWRADMSGKHWKHAAHKLYAWSKCDHPGVLKALGFAFFEGFILLVSPWMRNGSLTDHLSCSKPGARLHFCLEIVSTVEYLHGKGIVHGDLKADNVLVSDAGRTQLVDFGSTTLADYLTLWFSRTSRVLALSLRFAAPEVLDGSSKHHTTESDVYALGMLTSGVQQIMTGELPYAGMSDRVAVASIFRQVHPPRLTLNGIVGCQCSEDRLWNLLLRCWDNDPKLRPTATEVKRTLSGIAKESCAYYGRL